MGPYPQCEDDIYKLKYEHIDGVLNFMDQDEMAAKGLDTSSIKHIYQKNKIQFTKSINLGDETTEDGERIDNLFIAAQYLNDMANTKGLRVFLHSCAGVTRNTTVLLAYFTLYKTHELWHDLDQLQASLRDSFKLARPNMQLLKKLVKLKKLF